MFSSVFGVAVAAELKNIKLTMEERYCNLAYRIPR